MTSPSSSTRIRLQGCAKTFPDGTQGLAPLDLTIEGGETVVLLGPSGCGKTTTLRMIAGLEFPDAGGRVLFDDDDVTHLPIEKRSVGMVFQSYALFPNMTVAQNVAYGLRVRKAPKAEQKARVAEMLEMMQLGDYADRRISQLSGGQRQRVALARAIAVAPRVLLLDEPLTALDAKLRVSLREDINALLRGLGITAVYVTHDQEEAMALGDRIVAMDKGRIAQIGTPREIYQNPTSAFVADFIGTSNRMRVTAKNGQLSHPALIRPVTPPGSGLNGPTTLFFRPESLSLCDTDQANLKGIVEAGFFMGDRVRLRVKLAENEPSITLDAPATWDPQPGTPVTMRMIPEQVMAFEEPKIG